MKIYFAGPLFSLAERTFNKRLAAMVQNGLRDFRMEPILPQTKGEELLGDSGFVGKMFTYCINTIDGCDVVVAILEGSDADSGTCIEMGYAYACGKPIIGVRTDQRTSEDQGLNLMVSQVCARLIRDPQATVSSLADEVITAIRDIIGS